MRPTSPSPSLSLLASTLALALLGIASLARADVPSPRPRPVPQPQPPSPSQSRNKPASEPPAPVVTDPIEASAVIDAPVEKVWWAFTTKEGMEAWMVGLASIELKPGGRVLTRYAKDGTLGDAGTIEHALVTYDPLRLMVWQPVRAPAKFPFPAAWLRTWNIVYFEALPDGRTRVVDRMLGYDASPESQQARAFFARGNRMTLEALAAYFRKPQGGGPGPGK